MSRGDQRYRDFADDVEDELQRARAKFPGREHRLAALMEEVGELAQALLEDQGPERVWAEAVQVAAMAQRIAVEGDADFDKGP